MSDDLLAALAESINALHGKVDAMRDVSQRVSNIDTAFPVDAAGDRDYAMHHATHKAQSDKADEWRDLMRSVKKGVALWAILGLLAFLTTAALYYLLHGPAR